MDTVIRPNCAPFSLTRLSGFQRLFDMHEELCSNPEDIAEIPSVAGSEDVVKEKVIEAHRVLMGLNDENKARFEDLLVALEHS